MATAATQHGYPTATALFKHAPIIEQRFDANDGSSLTVSFFNCCCCCCLVFILSFLLINDCLVECIARVFFLSIFLLTDLSWQKHQEFLDSNVFSFFFLLNFILFHNSCTYIYIPSSIRCKPFYTFIPIKRSENSFI